MTNSVADSRRSWVALHLAARYLMKGVLTIKDVVECLEKLIDEQRLDDLCTFSSLGHHP